MLIEGGYLHSLKALLEKADGIESSKKPTKVPAPAVGREAPVPARGLSASLRKLGARLLRRTMN